MFCFTICQHELEVFMPFMLDRMINDVYCQFKKKTIEVDFKPKHFNGLMQILRNGAKSVPEESELRSQMLSEAKQMKLFRVVDTINKVVEAEREVVSTEKFNDANATHSKSIQSKESSDEKDGHVGSGQMQTQNGQENDVNKNESAKDDLRDLAQKRKKRVELLQTLYEKERIASELETKNVQERNIANLFEPRSTGIFNFFTNRRHKEKRSRKDDADAVETIRSVRNEDVIEFDPNETMLVEESGDVISETSTWDYCRPGWNESHTDLNLKIRIHHRHLSDDTVMFLTSESMINCNPNEEYDIKAVVETRQFEENHIAWMIRKISEVKKQPAKFTEKKRRRVSSADHMTIGSEASGQEDTSNDRGTVDWFNTPDGAAKQFRRDSFQE